MKGNSTFTDGAGNQTNLILLSQSNAKAGVIHFAKDLFRKVKTLFVQEDISETIVNTAFNNELGEIQPAKTVSKETIQMAISSVTVQKNKQLLHTNYQLNIQQMNLFTYLRRAITSSEESLSGQFLEQFKDFLSVIVGTAPDDNAPLGSVKQDFGILSYLGGGQLLSSKLFNSSGMRSWASVIFLTLFTAFGVLAQIVPAPDLSVKKTINNSNPTLGIDVTYTIKVQNSGAVATGVELTDLLPAGITLKNVTVSAGSETHTNGTSIIWNVGNVAAGTIVTPTELTMIVVGTVTARGLSFNVAEITKENEQDLDSTPNNKNFDEDDIDAVCFSIEDYWYKGDQFTINVPTGYTNITWTKKVGLLGIPIAITSATAGIILATDGSNIIVTDITAYTEFAFTASNKNCPVGGCCPAKFIPGPLGSIGDFVFKDTNGDGKQDVGELGVPGVKVILYKADGITKLDSTTTDTNGKYLFDSLFTDTYKVRFILPSGQTFSPSKVTATGFTDANDSDAGTGGFTSSISIDVEGTGKAKDNFDVDAGVIGNVGSIGDFVFRDDNSNGIQDGTEPGIAGVTVNLYKGSALLATAITDANGKYNFPNLGSATNYQVEFIAPTQSKFTGSLLGGDATKDSDANIAGRSGLITIDVTKLPTDVLRNNPTIDAGIIPLGSIGDYVFNDNNGNGIQDAGDTPVGAGIKVTLTDKDGNILTSTVTDANGKYEFIVSSGQYIVIFDKPAGTTFSGTGAGTPSTDSDANPATGKTGIITIDATKPVGDPARNNKDIDAGIKPICNINAGTLATLTPNFCLPVIGGIVLTATVATSPTVPVGYSVKYILTQGVNLVIQQVANTPTFTVTSAGEYRIHTLVFDGNSANANYLNLGVIVVGTTKATDVLGIINTNKLCAALDATGVKFNVNIIPDAPVFTAKTICAGEKVTIGLTGPIALAISYAWFESPTATIPFATTQSIEVSPSITTTYYVETTVVSPFACPSKRGSVIVTVNPKPSNPVAKSLTNDCTKNLQTVNLADAIAVIAAGTTIEWHTANDATSAIITNTTTVGAGTYYAFAKSTAGCYSGGVPVVVTITPCECTEPAIAAIIALTPICGNTATVVQLKAVIGGSASSGKWTSNGTGAFDNVNILTPKYTISAGDIANGSVEFTFTTNAPTDTKCIAAIAKTILSIKAKPAAPYNLRCDTLICLGESNKLFAVSQGNTVKWYATAISTVSIGNGSDNGFIVTPNAEGIFTYYAEATTPDGCVSDRSPISFRVKKCLTDLAVIKKVSNLPDAQSAPSFLLGQKIVYSIEVQNIGTTNATDVKVNDILPAGVTYVSSTPAGYNNGTGIWTIGNLTKGSNTVLLIEGTLNKIGSVTNTAVVSGTNEDPTKLGNNTSTVTIPVIDIADLSLVKVVDKSVVNVGDIVEYTITVLNSGPNTATNVEVKDKLPVGLTFVSSSTLINSSGTLTGIVASLANGTSTSFKFKATVTAIGIIKNLAEVSKSDQKDPDSTPGNASTKSDEDDDDSVDINSTQKCDVTPPLVDCKRKEICVGESTIITATGCTDGTIIWSNGQTGTSITVSPKANATYTAYCKKSNDCKSDPSNTVAVTVITISAPLLSASSSKICAGESVTLTAKGCDGTIEWQTSPVSNLPSIIVSPLVSNTYTAVCKQNGCVSPAGSVDVIVTPKPKAPEVLCEKEELCPGEDMTLTAINCNGQVKWSTGQETTTILVKPLVTTSYTVTCTINGCTSDPSKIYTITVKPLVIPTISATNTLICAGSSTNLTATGCTGKVTWYYDDKTLTGATIIVKPNTTTTYTATCSSVYCISDKSTPVTVKVENPVPPVVSAGTSTICAGSSVELTATGCNGIVTWSNGAIGNKITVSPTVSTSYTATCTIGTCVSPVSNKKDITVTDFAKPTITADKLAICAGMSIVLTSNGCNGTVTWSDGVTGSPRTITPSADIKYTATCESATCKSDKSNELSIKVNTPPAPPAITCVKTEICAGESVTLTAANCTGTVKWSDGQTGTSIIVKPSTTTTYSAICVTGSNCESVKSNEKTITVNPAVVLNLTASASPANICLGSETTLTLTGCTGTITWTGGLTGASIKVKPTLTTTYTATCSGVACSTDASANVKVTVLPGATTPTIATSGTQICVGGEVTLTANNCNGTVLWSNSATTAAITVKPIVTTTYTVQCKVEGCGDAKTSEPVIIKVGNPDAPTISSTSSTVCTGGSVVLTAVGCSAGTVVWSNGKTGNTITETINASTTYSAVCKQGTCNSPESNKVTVTVTIPSVPTISCATSTICSGSEITLIASGCEGTVKWSDGQTGTIIKTSPTKTTDYTATCTIGTCTSSPSSVATVNVGNPPAPTIVCNATTICQGIQITLTGGNCSGTIVWNDGQVGNVITAKPNATTKYTAICKLDKCESAKSNEVTITVGAGAITPKTKNLNNVCPFITVDLASGVTSISTGTYEYHTGVLPSSPLVSNPNAVGTGTYYVFEKTGTGCYSAPGVINVFINTDCTPIDCAKTPATVSAGADATICAEKIYKLSGTFGGAAKFIIWTTSGTGTFDNPTSPTATYRSSLADVIAGTVKLTITTNDPDGTGPCTAASASMTLIMQGVKFKPTVSVAGNLTTCSAEKVILTATTGTYGYKWFKVGTITEIASTKSITVDASGAYFFKIVDANKCCSIESDTVTVNYLTAPPTPTANSVKIDRGTTVDLTKLVVSNTPTGATLIFKIGALSSSTMVASPTAVGAGIYYACYKSAQGCFSEAAKITVENKDTGTKITDADVQITVTTENNIALDSTVKITITMKNNGPATAKGLTVSAPIPSGLTYLSATGGLVKTGSLLGAAVDSLISGGVKVYTWVGKISGGTTSVTVGATGGSTNPDPNPSNNNGSNPSGNVVVTVPPANSADIIVTITTDKINYVVGDTITTTIKVTNLGPVTAKNVIVASTVPSQLTYASQTGGLTKIGSVLTGKLDSLIKNGIKIYTYKSILTGTGPVVIVGTGTSNNPDPNPSNNNGSNNGNTPTGTTTINPSLPTGADVIVTVTTDKATYAVGDTVTTTIKVTNLGLATAKGISVYSAIPGTLIYIGQTGGLVKVGNMLTATIASLDKDGIVVYTYKAKLTSTGETVIAAGGTSTTTDPNPSNNNGTGSGTTKINAGVVDPTLADLAVIITADKSTAKVGDNVNFLITLTNNGPATAKQVVLSNVLPAGLTFILSSTGQVLTSGAITVILDSLQKGQSRTYAYVAKMNVKADITNTVSVSSLKDAISPNNFSFVIIKGDSVVTPTPTKKGAELVLNLSSDFQLITKDDEVTFTIKVINNGPEVATNVVVNNILPKYLSYISGQTTKTGDTLKAAVVSIPVGGVVTYTYKAKVVKDTIISNTARIMKSTPVDSILTNNVSTVVLVPANDTTYADLGVLITANKATYKKDENVTYTVTLINNGAGKAKNVQLCGTVPAGLTYVSGTNGIVKTGDSLKFKGDTISKGVVRIYTYVVKASTIGSITNAVKICNSSKSDLILPNNTSSVTIKITADSIPPVVDSCKLGLAMAVIDTAKVSNGVYNITYRLIAKNFCKDTLRNVTLTSNIGSTFKTPVICELVGKPNSGLSTNLLVNDLFSKADSNLVKPGSYILPGAVDTIKYVVKITLNGNKGPFYSQGLVTGKRPSNTVLTAKSSDGANVNGTPSKTVLRFDLPNTRIGLAKEVVTTALKNDSTTYWTVPFRIRVVNMGVNLIKSLSVKDSLDAVFTAKGATIVGIPTIIATPGLTINKQYTGKGSNTELLVPDSSSIAKGDTAIIDLTVRVNTILSSDPDNIFNNVAIGNGKGSDNATYRDISTNGNNPDKNGDKDPSNDNEATPVKLKTVDVGTPSIGIALVAVSDTIPLADSTCNVTLIMTVRNYANVDLKKIRLCHNLETSIGTQVESWKLIGLPRVIKGKVKINPAFNGKTDSTLVKADSSFLAKADTIQIAYMINIKRPVSDTIYTQAIAKAISSSDSTKIFSDLSVNGINPDVNGNGKAEEASLTPIICKGAATQLTSIFIPQGFSPNGDGKNDNFVIQGVKPTEQVELIIFNRYGGVVYANQDYKNDWSGASNQGVKVIGDGQGLSDGTYFYSITRSLRADGTKVDLKPIVRYITIMR